MEVENRYYYKVLHSGGLVVRISPNFSSDQTGEIVQFDSIVTGKQIVQVDQDKFVQLLHDGWIVAEKGSLKALEEVH